MPKMNGVKVCKMLKSNMNTSNLPIIVLSGMGSTIDRIAGIDAGADEYLIKPFDVDERRSRVAAVLSRRLRARNVHWPTGIPSEAALKEEVDRLLADDGGGREFEILIITLHDLGRLQRKYSSSAAERHLQNVADKFWEHTLKVKHSVAAQLRAGQWRL